MDGARGRLALLFCEGVVGDDWVRLETIARDADVLPESDAGLSRLGEALGRVVGPVDWLEVDRQLAAMERAHARLVCRWDAEYPEALRATATAPPALFLRGCAGAMQAPAAGIVGTRAPSGPGLGFTVALARSLASLGIAVVSGLARGIDTAAHGGALEAQGRTVAVLGTGVDVVYPPENGSLMERVVATGAVISEQPCGTRARSHVFPRRNRIISGLCDAVVVVEGGAKSGALITARWALDQGREVGAVPGFPGDFRSDGPNRLLREGAFLVERAEDVIANMPCLARACAAAVSLRAREPKQGSLFAGLDAESERVYALLSGRTSADELARAAGIDVAAAQRALAMLEIEGRVARDEGGSYHRLDRRGWSR